MEDLEDGGGLTVTIVSLMTLTQVGFTLSFEVQILE